MRGEIAASVLARRYGISEQTVYKWKKRFVFGDRSHTAHRLQTVLTTAQKTIVVHLRATRWVFVAIKVNKCAASAQVFLKALHKICPIRIQKLLTDNGKEFTDR